MNYKNKIYFVCPDTKTPTGGIKQIYRQVDILNKNGFNACILHRNKGFRVNWFENNTKIEYNRAIFKKISYAIRKKPLNSFLIDRPLNKIKNHFNDDLIEPNSILVFPEIYGPGLHTILTEYKKVIFNQNCYYTFNHFDHQDENLSIYKDQNIIGVIVASEDAQNYLEFTFGKINLYRIRLGINENNFSFQSTKKNQIAFMPRKLKEDVNQIISILKQRSNLKRWDFVAIENKSESDVGKILKESKIFLSLNHREGFGLPPAEAMACGCLVIGYTGQGGKEYFNPHFTYPIEERNVIDFSKKIEEIAIKLENNDALVIDKGKQASEFILDNYNIKNEEKDTLTVWENILQKNF